MISKFEAMVIDVGGTEFEKWCKQIEECTFTNGLNNADNAKKLAQFLKLSGKEDVFIDENLWIVFYYENGEFFKCETDLELQEVIKSINTK